MFPPPENSFKDNTWCNSYNDRKNWKHINKIPTTRPVGDIGGHLCCDDADFCNRYLRPPLRNNKYPNKSYDEGSRIHLFVFVLFQCVTL